MGLTQITLIFGCLVGIFIDKYRNQKELDREIYQLHQLQKEAEEEIGGAKMIMDIFGKKVDKK